MSNQRPPPRGPANPLVLDAVLFPVLNCLPVEELQLLKGVSQGFLRVANVVKRTYPPGRALGICDKLVATGKKDEAIRWLLQYIATNPRRRTDPKVLSRFMSFIHSYISTDAISPGLNRRIFYELKKKAVQEQVEYIKKAQLIPDPELRQLAVEEINDIFKSMTIGPYTPTPIIADTVGGVDYNISALEDHPISSTHNNQDRRLQGIACCLIAYLQFKQSNNQVCRRIGKLVQQHNPDSSIGAWIMAVLSRYDLRDQQSAADGYVKSFTNGPEFAYAYYSLGVLMQETGNIKGAIDMYKRAIKIDKNFTFALWNITIIDPSTININKLRIKNIIEIDPMWAPAHIGLVRIIKEQIQGNIIDHRAESNMHAENTRTAARTAAHADGKTPEEIDLILEDVNRNNRERANKRYSKIDGINMELARQALELLEHGLKYHPKSKYMLRYGGFINLRMFHNISESMRYFDRYLEVCSPDERIRMENFMEQIAPQHQFDDVNSDEYDPDDDEDESDSE
jgi:tetratricopeptide (TPR) repeat protein